MAVSAFKSTSKRGDLRATSTTTSSSSSSSSTANSSRGRNSDNLDKNINHRRSRSVSAAPRIHPSPSFDDFVNKMDNPLFNSSSPEANESKKLVGVPSVGRNGSKLDKSPSKPAGNEVLDSRRGRSVSRSSDNGNQLAHGRKGTGQSLSRIDNGRRYRSVSRAPVSRVHRVDSESESENKYDLSSTSKSKSIENSRPSGRKTDSVVTSDSEQWSRTRNPLTWSSQHPLSEPSDQFYSSSRADYREDVTSTSSYSEAEEKTILAFTEQIKSFQRDLPTGEVGKDNIYAAVRSEVRRAINEIQGDLDNVIQRKNLTSISKTNVADIPPELVNTDAIELVSEIRSEYGAKLKQSQERARKLRADLAVEEHREQEFSRILEEILPEPKNPPVQKGRPRRKNSIERRKMSKRLTEEALNYFDECVSISTFDGSDFSTDDPLCNSSLSDAPTHDNRFLAATSSANFANNYSYTVANNYKFQELDKKSEITLSHDDSQLLTSEDSQGLFKTQDNLTDSTASQNRKFQFSLTREPAETAVIRHEMGNFIKMFEKDIQTDGMNNRVVRSSYIDGDYSALSFPDERLLFDMVVLKNRIESGLCLVCDSWT